MNLPYRPCGPCHDFVIRICESKVHMNRACCLSRWNLVPPDNSNHPTSRIADRLDGFQPDFSLLLGACFANPDHAAELGACALLIEDEFDYLTAPNVETSTQPETSL